MVQSWFAQGKFYYCSVEVFTIAAYFALLGKIDSPFCLQNCLFLLAAYFAQHSASKFCQGLSRTEWFSPYYPSIPGQLGHPVCSFQEQRVLFGSVPLGLNTVRTVHLKNNGHSHTFFKVCSNLNSFELQSCVVALWFVLYCVLNWYWCVNLEC